MCVTLTAVLGKSENDVEVRRARKAVVEDPRVRALVDRLPDWESGFTFSGHNAPAFPPNILRLLPCDHFAILEVLLLFGHKDAPGVERALARVRETLAGTAQGPAWHCIPDPVAKWRGPGRKNEVSLELGQDRQSRAGPRC